jgi:hypothetical protein
MGFIHNNTTAVRQYRLLASPPVDCISQQQIVVTNLD